MSKDIRKKEKEEIERVGDRKNGRKRHLFTAYTNKENNSEKNHETNTSAVVWGSIHRKFIDLYICSQILFSLVSYTLLLIYTEQRTEYRTA